MQELYFAQSWRRITDNGKSIGEVRSFEERKFKKDGT